MLCRVMPNIPGNLLPKLGKRLLKSRTVNILYLLKNKYIGVGEHFMAIFRAENHQKIGSFSYNVLNVRNVRLLAILFIFVHFV